jgi:hypothetical protein
MGLIFGSHVFIFMDALGLGGDSCLVLEVEATTYNCYYKDNMGRSLDMKPPFHVHIKLFQFLQTSPKSWMSNIHPTCIPTTLNIMLS